MQNPYHTSYQNNFLIPSHMASSQLSYNQSLYQNRQHRNSLQTNNYTKVLTSSRTNGQIAQNPAKTRQISEQKNPQKNEIPNPLFTHSQVVYGNGQIRMPADYAQTSSTTFKSFQEMNIKIKDPVKIQEDPRENQSSNSRSTSPLKIKQQSKQVNQLNQEWSDILQKTKCLEQNLLILRNSVDKNLMKINRNKASNNPLEQNSKQLQSKSQLQHNSSVRAIKNSNDTYTQLVSSIHYENFDRFSKESISSKSTNNQSEKPNFYGYHDAKLISSSTKGILKQPIKTKAHFLLPSSQTNSSFINKSFGGKIPQTPEQLEQPNLFFSKDRITSTSQWKGEQNIIKVQMPSRLNSPLQTKLSKETAIQTSNFQNSERNKSTDKQENMTLSRICFEIPKTSNFSNTSAGWYNAQNKERISPFLTIELKLKIKVGRFLGRGKFSDVYLARDEVSGFVFALKIIKKEIVSEFQMEEQIAREIKIQWSLDHPNIVKMFGCDYDKKHIYLLLEYCEQGELFQHQNKQEKRRFQEEQASNYIGQILNAIQYMHERNVMHRDLKTENILLSFNQIKLCDLGCVSDFIERRRTFCGTIDYIAPEVIVGGEELQSGYDQRCDVWQIAILAYELVAGKAPFTDAGPRNEDSIMENIIKVKNCLSSKAQKEAEMPKYFSKELISFLKGGLQKSPDNRSSLHLLMKHLWIQKNNPEKQESLLNLLKKFDKY